MGPTLATGKLLGDGLSAGHETLRRITTCAAADRLLQNGFTDNLNGKFAVAPIETYDYHIHLTANIDLDGVFCFEEYRVVQNDWCIRHENSYYQILKDNKPLPRPKDKILVRIHLDGRTQLFYRDKPLVFRSLSPKQLHHQGDYIMNSEEHQYTGENDGST